MFAWLLHGAAPSDRSQIGIDGIMAGYWKGGCGFQIGPTGAIGATASPTQLISWNKPPSCQWRRTTIVFTRKVSQKQHCVSEPTPAIAARKCPLFKQFLNSQNS
jgi:hypothetical protein